MRKGRSRCTGAADQPDRLLEILLNLDLLGSWNHGTCTEPIHLGQLDQYAVGRAASRRW